MAINSVIEKVITMIYGHLREDRLLVQISSLGCHFDHRGTTQDVNTRMTMQGGHTHTHTHTHEHTVLLHIRSEGQLNELLTTHRAYRIPSMIRGN